MKTKGINDGPTHYMAVGDLRTALGRQLTQGRSPVDLSGLTVQAKMVQADANAPSGTVVFDWQATGVTVVDAATGKVKYSFAASDVDTAGTFYLWFRIGDGTNWDTFPPGDRAIKIVITAVG